MHKFALVRKEGGLYDLGVDKRNLQHPHPIIMMLIPILLPLLLLLLPLLLPLPPLLPSLLPLPLLLLLTNMELRDDFNKILYLECNCRVCAGLSDSK